jgi:hypothetical protein
MPMTIAPARRTRAWHAFVFVTLSAGMTASSAQDGGPDYYRVSGVSSGSALNLRSNPSIDATVIGRIPAGVDGLRNLGCEGGLSLPEFERANAAEREAATRTRWCQVDYQGVIGWAAGWYLAEGGPIAGDADRVRDVDTDLQAGSPKIFEDRIVGYGSVNYSLNALAGQTLDVELDSDNSFVFFNVRAPNADTALFAGAASTSPDRWTGTLADSGTHIVTVFMMRNAARRNETGNFTISLTLD